MSARGSILPLAAHNLRVMRDGRCLLGPVNLRLERRGITLVIGPNGAGKSTLLRVLNGLEAISEGGRMAWSLPRDQVRARQAFVFQAPVMMRRSVRDNLAYPLILRGMSRREARARAEVRLGELGLAGAARRPASTLSGGERQKLALARALIRDPEVLFLDEPCANLDGPATAAVEAMLHAAKARATRCVMTSHDLGQVRRLADDVIFIHRGKVLEATPAADFFARPQTPEAAAFLRGDIVT